MVIIGTPNVGPQNPEDNAEQNPAVNPPECPNVELGPTDLTPLECANAQDMLLEGGNIMALELGNAINGEQTAPITTVNGTSVVAKQRAISILQGQAATIAWQMHDSRGVPVDLSPLMTDSSLKVLLRIKEQISLNNSQSPPKEIDMELVTPEVGKVSVAVTPEMVANPGVYYAEVALVSSLTDPPTLIFANVFSLIISRSTFGTNCAGGPPSIAEIRLHLRDSSPAESFLLDNLMFDDAEIALAITRPIMYWNEVPPPIQEYTTETFPFRYHWLEGICANLFFMVAEQFRRNQLDYAAAGVTVNDQNKEQNYERAGQMRWQMYMDWVKVKKAQINLEGGYGTVGSIYTYGAYSSGIRSRY